MENQNNNNLEPAINQKSSLSLKIIVAVLAILLIGSLVYIFKMTSESEAVKKQLVTTISEKESVMKDLQELKAAYDAAIAKNTSMSAELVQERDKVVRLMDELRHAKGDLSKFKSQVAAMQDKMTILIAENDNLKKKNSALTVQRDSTITVLGKSKKSNEVLVSKNEELTKSLEKGSKLAILDTKALGYKLKSSGKEIETDKASRVNVLRVRFTIAENQIAKPGDRTYYVQVIDSRNDILGDKKTESFGNKSLTYSFLAKVKYENKNVTFSQDLTGKKFEKGTYFINIFENSELVSKASLTFR